MILAGVYDAREWGAVPCRIAQSAMAWPTSEIFDYGQEIKRKIRPEEDHKANSPLFESLMNELYDYPELNLIISRMLFQEEKILYNPDDKVIKNAFVLGFLKVQDSSVQIANRIFETRLYNRILLDKRRESE